MKWLKCYQTTVFVWTLICFLLDLSRDSSCHQQITSRHTGTAFVLPLGSRGSANSSGSSFWCQCNPFAANYLEKGQSSHKPSFWICLTCLEKLEKVKTYSPKWWCDGDLPWYKVKIPSHFGVPWAILVENFRKCLKTCLQTLSDWTNHISIALSPFRWHNFRFEFVAFFFHMSWETFMEKPPNSLNPRGPMM